MKGLQKTMEVHKVIQKVLTYRFKSRCNQNSIYFQKHIQFRCKNISVKVFTLHHYVKSIQFELYYLTFIFNPIFKNNQFE